MATSSKPAMAAPNRVEEWFQMVPHLISEEGRERLQLRGGLEGRSRALRLPLERRAAEDPRGSAGAPALRRTRRVVSGLEGVGLDSK
eukprot:Skav228534  [mRNA]  locus=scaffold1887:112751:114234:+ [translate_table: standard]